MGHVAKIGDAQPGPDPDPGPGPGLSPDPGRPDPRMPDSSLRVLVCVANVCVEVVVYILACATGLPGSVVGEGSCCEVEGRVTCTLWKMMLRLKMSVMIRKGGERTGGN